MTPQDAISALDRQLAQHGQDVLLVKVSGAVSQFKFFAPCRAFVRNYEPRELIGTIVQGDSEVTISPTDLDSAHWPGAYPEKNVLTTDPRVPTNNDKVIFGNKTRNIQAPIPVYLDGELVKIKLQVRG